MNTHTKRERTPEHIQRYTTERNNNAQPHEHNNHTEKTFSQDTDTRTHTETTYKRTNECVCVFDLSVRWRHASSSVVCGSQGQGEVEGGSRFALQTEVFIFETGDLQKYWNVRFQYERGAQFSEMSDGHGVRSVSHVFSSDAS